MKNTKRANCDVSGDFINFSNHPSQNWCDEQVKAAHEFTGGEIMDVPFPQVNASADETEIFAIASDCADKLCSLHPAVVMCQGEFGITFIVVNLLKAKGIRVIYSCSERRTAEKKTENGSIKTSEFSFVRFRKY